MARRCSVCSHPQAHEINLALLRSASIRDVAGRFSLSRTAVGNHALQHLPDRVAEARATSVAPADCNPLQHPPADAFAAAVQQHDAARLAENATLRDHVVRDVRLIDNLIAAAVAAGQPSQVLTALRTKYLITARGGLAAQPDAALAGSPSGGNASSPPDRRDETVRMLHEDIREMLEAGRAVRTGEVGEIAPPISDFVAPDDDDELVDLVAPAPLPLRSGVRYRQRPRRQDDK